MNQMLQEPEVQLPVPTLRSRCSAPDIAERPARRQARAAFRQAAADHLRAGSLAPRHWSRDAGIAYVDELRRAMSRARRSISTRCRARSKFRCMPDCWPDAALYRDLAAGLMVDSSVWPRAFVADTVIKALDGCPAEDYKVPVFSAVLTPQQFHESTVHHEFFRKHFVIKGIEVAEACANTLHSLERLRGQVAAGIV